MTAIVPSSIKTKKALKAHLAAQLPLRLNDPTPFGDHHIHLNYTDSNGNLHHLINGHKLEACYQICCCTNHPRRSWFAQIILKPNGTLKVT